MALEEIYVHYGASVYNPELFQPVKNEEGWTKPTGGLWASPISAKYGWDKYCLKELYGSFSVESFHFKISSTANVIYLESKKDLENLPKINLLQNKKSTWVYLDFEKIVSLGIDAIQANISKDTTPGLFAGLYNAIYGWDCDSLLVLNKEIIQIC